MSKLTKPLESATRKEIDLILTNLGWITNESLPECNVFTERAKTIEQDNKFKGNDPDYVLYKSGTDDPIGIIEAKRKGQSIDQAVSDAEQKYAKPLNIKIIFAYDGAFFKSWHIEAQRELLVDGVTITQLITEKKLLRFLEEGYSISEISPKVKHSRAELINIFKWANDLLRKEGLREGIERFTEFANLLFLKLITEMERERIANKEPRILDDIYLWDSFNRLDASVMMSYINNTVLPFLVEKYNHSGDVFESKLAIQTPKTLKLIVDKLSALNLMDADSDVKGDAFEYFLKDSVTVGNDLGEYFTPRHIVDLMIQLVEPKFGETIYDPTCGTGGFLISAFRYIKKRCANTPENLMFLKEKTVYGRELTNTAKIAKMNMILTGDGHTNIVQTDSLAHPVTDAYKVSLANPPYGQATDYGGYYPVASNDGDAVFIQHIFKSLKKDGRAAVIVPEGLLFKGGDMLDVRKYLMKHYCIDGVISLPQGVFRPYANNKTNIIVFHEDPHGTKSVWFYDLKSDYRRPVDENDIPDLLDKWSDKRESAKSWISKLDEIEQNKWDLLAKTYEPKKKISTEKAIHQYPQVKFSTIMEEAKRMMDVDDSKEYQRITVQWYGKGIIPRDMIFGKKLKIKKQKITQTEQFIVAEIDAKSGSFGVIPEELAGSIVSSHYFLFNLDKTKVYPKFFDFVIRYGNYDKLIQPKVKGTTNYSAIRPQDVLELTLPLPPIEEQRMLADRFEKQESIVNQIDMTVKTLEQGIVDKSDFQGDWKFEDLEELCEDIKTGGTPPRTNLLYFKGDIPWVKISDMKPLDYIMDTEEKLTPEALQNSNAKLEPKGSVLISIFASIGTVSILGIDACTNQAIASLKPRTDKIISEFLMYYLHTLKPYYVEKARGIAQKNINTEIMKAVKVPVPPLDIQQTIIDKIKERKQIITELEQAEVRALQTIKLILESECGLGGVEAQLSRDTRMSDFVND
jgi:type I restriction enzyme M protein